jgi:thiamine-phosphate diphosphorylase
MSEMPERPLVYLITEGRLTDENFPEASGSVIEIFRAAIDAGITMIQIREKDLSAKFVTELAAAAVALAKNTDTKIFVNDRADVAAAANADGVHLTESSMPVDVVKQHFPGLLIGVSRHSAEAIEQAAADGADFAVFGSVFETPGKTGQGIAALKDACSASAPFPVIAVGGINAANYQSVLDAGAAGYAAIRQLNDIAYLKELTKSGK